MEQLFNQVKPVFDKHKSKSNVEFEFRLGKVHGRMFDTNVGKVNFNKILSGLETYQDWEKVVHENTSVYYKGNTRMIIDDDTENVKCMEKTKIQKFDKVLNNQPYDIRFCVSHEKPVDMDDSEVMDYLRIKRRTSFIRKNLSIDMTVVTGQPDDPDDEEEEKYEIEIEIINPQLVNTDNKLYNMVYKIECILNILSD